jgi:5'-nucleotidase
VKLLLTNDDGIDAPGLAALEASIPAGIPYVVIAPDSQRSECSHTVTTRHDLNLRQLAPQRWSLSGTPVDCVRVAVALLAPDLTAVLSGVNDGGNLGADVHISGTVAAARESALHGIPGIAISHYRRPGDDRGWDHVPQWIGEHLRELLHSGHRESASGEMADYWNINLPSLTPALVPECVETRLDRHPMPVQFTRQGDVLTYKGDYHGRPKLPGTDISECFAGKISISRLRLS